MGNFPYLKEIMDKVVKEWNKGDRPYEDPLRKVMEKRTQLLLQKKPSPASIKNSAPAK